MKFKMKQKVLFKHCDPAGIVFYPRYFEMINDCVEMFFYEIGVPFETLHPTSGVPTAQISTTFHAPSIHGDNLIINLEVIKIGGASLRLSINADCRAEQRFSSDVTIVYVNKNGRPQNWSDSIRNALTLYLRSDKWPTQ